MEDPIPLHFSVTQPDPDADVVTARASQLLVVSVPMGAVGFSFDPYSGERGEFIFGLQVGV